MAAEKANKALDKKQTENSIAIWLRRAKDRMNNKKKIKWKIIIITYSKYKSIFFQKLVIFFLLTLMHSVTTIYTIIQKDGFTIYLNLFGNV